MYTYRTSVADGIPQLFWVSRNKATRYILVYYYSYLVLSETIFSQQCKANPQA